MATAGRFTDLEYREQADFRRALHEYLRRADKNARDRGLTPQHYLLLLVLRGHRKYPRVTIGDIADALQLTQPSTSLLVDRCVKLRHLLRQRDPADRRRVLVGLSPSGQTLLDDIMEANRRDLGRLNSAFIAPSFHVARVLSTEGDALATPSPDA
jgi:DNA-binding MarR family transcriptional regulator